MSTRSSQGGKPMQSGTPGSEHLQIRSLWASPADANAPSPHEQRPPFRPAHGYAAQVPVPPPGSPPFWPPRTPPQQGEPLPAGGHFASAPATAGNRQQTAYVPPGAAADRILAERGQAQAQPSRYAQGSAPNAVYAPGPIHGGAQLAPSLPGDFRFPSAASAVPPATASQPFPPQPLAPQHFAPTPALPSPSAPTSSAQDEPPLDWPIGLRHVRPGVAYTRGVPTPRVAGQQWEEEFRSKLVAAIEQRRRRAFWSLSIAGGGVVVLVACFAALLVLRGTDTADDARPQVADASQIEERAGTVVEQPRLAGVTRQETPAAVTATARRRPLTHPNAPQLELDSARDGLLDLASADQNLLTTLAPSGTSVPARIVSNRTGEAAARPAPASAPQVLRTRLRIVGDANTDPGAMILLRGMPDGISLSDGMSPSPGTWVLGLESARNLQIVSPAGYRGSFKVSLEVMGPGGVALLRQDADMTVPASALVIVLPRLPETLAPALSPQRRAPHVQAQGGVGGPRPGAVPDKALGTQIAVEDRPSPGTTAEPSAPRRMMAPPAYGLGGPR